MLIFSGSSNKELTRKVAQGIGLTLGSLEIVTFPDNENRVRVVDEVLDEDVVVIQSTGVTPNLYYLELFFIIDSLKRSGAKSITLVVPYLGYQRQDHIFRDGEAVSLEVIIRLLESLGISKLISFDFHSVRIPQLFKVPVVQLSALEVFADEINKMNKDDLILVSPDMGGIGRVSKLSELTDGIPYISIVKDRDLNTGDIESAVVNGDVRKKVIIVDDVISTGKTLVAAANLLKENGAIDISVMATHGIFANDAATVLQNSVINKVLVTDTIEISHKRTFPKLEIISIAKLITQTLRD
jgi:ribose-phosphate pyrophosphokinase